MRYVSAAAVGFGILLASVNKVYGQPLCAGPFFNVIVQENCKKGTPRALWDLGGWTGAAPGARDSGDRNIEGFATNISYNLGDTVEFKVKTISTKYHIDIYRVGFYQGY